MFNRFLQCLLVMSLGACAPRVKICVEDRTATVEEMYFKTCGQNYPMREEQAGHWTSELSVKLKCEAVTEIYASTTENNYRVGEQYLSNAPIGDLSYSFYLDFDETGYRDSAEKVIKVAYRQSGKIKSETCLAQNKRLWEINQKYKKTEKPDYDPMWGTKNN